MDVAAKLMESGIASVLFPGEDRNSRAQGMSCGLEPLRDMAIAICEIKLNEDDDPEKIAKKALNGLSDAWSTDSEEVEMGVTGEDAVKIPTLRKRLGAAKAESMAALFRDSES